MSSRTALFAGTGAAALLALAACTPAKSGGTATPAPSATASPTSTAGAGQGGSGTVVTRSTTAATPHRSTPGPSWDGVDFAAEARTHTHCLPDVKKDQVFSVKYADVTGDGRTEALVTAACPSETSQNPVAVFVFDGQDRQRPLTLLAAIGADHDLTEIKVSTEGRQISIDARGRSQHTGLCCPDLRITETWTWRGGHLVRTSSQQRPL